MHRATPLPYSSVLCDSSLTAIRTHARSLGGARTYHSTTLVATMQCQNAVFKGGESSRQFQWFTIAKIEL